MKEDLYQILGVLPSAEGIVIDAAYRALAQLYIPDRCPAPQTEPNEAVAAIARAHEILKDPVRRSVYDAQYRREHRATYGQQQDLDREAAFEQAINALEMHWKIVTDVFPDLISLKENLAKLSSGLAFSFMTVMLERKNFKNRQALSESMQDMYLEHYFGTDSIIKIFAKELIEYGAKDAAKMLNELVNIFDSSVPATHLIERVKRDHRDAILGIQNKGTNQNRYSQFKSRFAMHPTVKSLRDLCEAVGYSMHEKGVSFCTPVYYEVKKPNSTARIFFSQEGLIAWGLREFKLIYF